MRTKTYKENIGLLLRDPDTHEKIQEHIILEIQKFSNFIKKH